MSIFDEGRATGALGGGVAAETDRRTFRDSDLAYKQKNAEFMNYMMDAELRSEVRKTGKMQAQAIRSRLPSETAASISGNQLDQKQNNSDLGLVDDNASTTRSSNQTTRSSNSLTQAQNASTKKLLPDAERQMAMQMHANMQEMEYNKATRTYGAMKEALAQQGADPEQIYNQHRNQLIQDAFDPDQMAADLEKAGAGQTYTEKSLNALIGVANIAIHDAKLVREEHMLEAEWGHRRALEIAKARAGTEYDPSLVKKEEIEQTGAILSKSVEMFDKLDGKLNEDKTTYSGSKGALVNWTTAWSRAQMRDKKNNPYVTATDYQKMATDMLNFMGKQSTSETYWGYGGDKFLPSTFETGMNTAVNMMEGMKYGIEGGDQMPYDELWSVTRMSIMLSLSDTDQRIKSTLGSLPEAGEPVGEGDPSSGSYRRGALIGLATDTKTVAADALADLEKATGATRNSTGSNDVTSAQYQFQAAQRRNKSDATKREEKTKLNFLLDKARTEKTKEAIMAYAKYKKEIGE